MASHAIHMGAIIKHINKPIKKPYLKIKIDKMASYSVELDAIETV